MWRMGGWGDFWLLMKHWQIWQHCLHVPAWRCWAELGNTAPRGSECVLHCTADLTRSSSTWPTLFLFTCCLALKDEFATPCLEQWFPCARPWIVRRSLCKAGRQWFLQLWRYLPLHPSRASIYLLSPWICAVAVTHFHQQNMTWLTLCQVKLEPLSSLAASTSTFFFWLAHCLFLQIKLYWHTATPIATLSMAAFVLQWQSWVVAAET